MFIQVVATHFYPPRPPPLYNEGRKAVYRALLEKFKDSKHAKNDIIDFVWVERSTQYRKTPVRSRRVCHDVSCLFPRNIKLILSLNRQFLRGMKG